MYSVTCHLSSVTYHQYIVFCRKRHLAAALGDLLIDRLKQKDKMPKTLHNLLFFQFKKLREELLRLEVSIPLQ